MAKSDKFSFLTLIEMRAFNGGLKRSKILMSTKKVGEVGQGCLDRIPFFKNHQN